MKDQLIVGVNDTELDPPKPDHIRLYEMFHEYRDYSPEEMKKMMDDLKDDPFVVALQKSITEEINREIIAEIMKAAKK